jgi:multidrug efflux pump subunit AcrB
MPEYYKYRPFSPFSVVVVFLALMLAGASFIPLQNLRFKPSRSMPEITVRFNWFNASPEVIEEQSARIEGALSRLDQVKSVTSTSTVGSGQVIIEFDRYANMAQKRYEISTQLRQLRSSFPEGMSYPELTATMADDEGTTTFMTLTLNAHTTTHYIREVAEALVIPELTRIEGITDVKLYGATPNQWEISFDPALLRNYQIGVSELETLFRRMGEKDFLGNHSTGAGHTAPVFLVSRQMETTEWQMLPVALKNGRIIRVSDVATVKKQERPPTSYFRINGKNTINLVLLSSSSSNQIRLSQQVRQAIAGIGHQLPTGYGIAVASDSSDFIRNELSKIGIRTIFSLLILLAFVLLSTRSFRVLAVLTIALVANLLIAFAFYYLLKVEIHLYSLAGITVSFGIIIDNSILMVSHMQKKKGLHVFIAILAATLTTLAALSVIFFLKENQKILLVDFVYVMLINLSISLVVALLLVPSLMSLIYKPRHQSASLIRSRKRIIKFTGWYGRYIAFGQRFRWAFVLLAILIFGLPVWLIPEKMKGESRMAIWYNKTIGGETWQQKIKPLADKALGGTIRLFKEHVYEGNFYADPSRTALYVRGTMPDGCTIHQLNDAVRRMEQYISQFDEVEQFQTSISSHANGMIIIHFKPEAERSAFPYIMKSQLEQQAIMLGGMDWGVWGVGRGFSNALGMDYRNSRILLTGYNYAQLFDYAEQLEAKLLENQRVENTEIASTQSWRGTSRTEFYLQTDRELLAWQGLSFAGYTSSLFGQLYYRELNPIYTENELQPVVLLSGLYDEYNRWDFYNQPVATSKGDKKLAEAGSIEKRLAGKTIYKKDQVYHLYVNYNFKGPGTLSKMVQDRHIDELNEKLPLGYRASSPENWYMWNVKEKKQYFLLGLILLIIYFICSILFESLRKPLAVITAIPISYVGVFLTFYLFKFNFDQGGFASFIMLSGLVVNAAIYIINDFNNLVTKQGKLPNVKTYLKAFNQKIVAIMLTILSTVLGLVPFLWGGQREVFWFAFASGAIGGLIFSLVAILIFLPLFLPVRRMKNFR